MSFAQENDDHVSSTDVESSATEGIRTPAQEHVCTICRASFTRKTHLTRHLRSHLNQRTYNCTLCGRATFTRSDLLTRHMKRCSLNPGGVPPSRKKACQACIQRKVKCDLQEPCARCSARGDDCVYVNRRGKQAGGKHEPSRGATDHIPTDTKQTHETSADGRTEPAGPRLEQDSLFMNSVLDPTASLQILDDHAPPLIRDPGPSTLAIPGPSLFSDPSYLPIQPPPSESIYFDSTFLNDFLNQADNTSGFSLPTPSDSVLPQFSLSIPRPLGPAAELITDADRIVPNLDLYLALYFTVHCRQYPLEHHTLNQCPTPITGRAMRACGALYVTGNNTESKAADQFILECLQSGLRQQIYRTFIETPRDDMEAQAALLLAMASVQSLGLFHRSSEERSVSAAFHGMLVTMVRRCAIPAFLDAWEMPAIGGLNTPEAWKSWAYYESMKRLLSFAWLHDSLMTTFYNLPPSFGESELPIRLPCDVELWEAPTAQRWAELLGRRFLSQSFRPEDLAPYLRGELLSKTLADMLSPFSVVVPPPLNRFASFMTIHALHRYIFLTKPSDIDQRITIQHGLTQWYLRWLSGASTSSESPHSPTSSNASPDKLNFTAAVLPMYWMALLWLEQADPSAPVCSIGQVRFNTIKRWLKTFWSVLRDVGEVGVGVGLVDLPETGAAYIEEMQETEGIANKAADAGLREWIPIL